MGMSHWLFFRPFVTELVRRGHNVTLLSYFGIDEVELRGQQNYHEYLFKRDAILTNTFDLQVCDLLFNCPSVEYRSFTLLFSPLRSTTLRRFTRHSS